MFKGCFEFTEIVIGRRKPEPLLVFSEGVELYQLFGNLFDGVFGLLFG